MGIPALVYLRSKAQARRLLPNTEIPATRGRVSHDPLNLRLKLATLEKVSPQKIENLVKRLKKIAQIENRD